MNTLPSEQTLRIDQEISIAAAPTRVFAALLERLGPANSHPDGCQPGLDRWVAWLIFKGADGPG